MRSAQVVANLPEGSDLAQGVDFDDINARALQSMATMTPDEVMQALEENYRTLIEAVRSLPDELMNKKFRFVSDPIPMSDILATNIMVHGLHHVYEAYSRLNATADTG